MTKEQKLLFGEGTVKQREQGLRIFDMLAELLSKPRTIIGHRGWSAMITEEQKTRIQMERLKQIKNSKGEKITEATDYEALTYIATASMDAPLDRMWTRIYFHLLKRFYPDNSDFIEDHEAILQLQDKQYLCRLKQWIYKQG